MPFGTVGGSVSRVVRLSPDFIRRIEALAPWMARDSRIAPMGTVKESHAIRVILDEGLKAMEARRCRAKRKGGRR
jgi:hypothetical protein